MKYTLSIIVVALFVVSSIYDFVVYAADGPPIDLGNFHNKKILIVNIATGSNKVDQLGQLQELQEEYADSLVVIAFPSNSFGNENRSNTAIKAFCESEYDTEFLIAAKGSVKGADIQPLYKWLTRQSENGVLNSEVKSDFQKYIIDRNGEILSVFTGDVSPLSSEFISAITSH